jgi:hypothetical protein
MEIPMSTSKFLLIGLAAIGANAAAAQTGDLTLPGERYSAPFDRYICSSFDETGVAEPAAITANGVVFEKLTSDAGLDNFLLVLTYASGDATCRYSAIIQPTATRGIAARTESLAYSTSEGVDCSAGKDYLDAWTGSLPYAYFERRGQPVQVSLGLPLDGLESQCGEGATKIGIVFKHHRGA